MKEAPKTQNVYRSTVLVMGGSGVIGRALCLKFASAQWTVGVHYHRNKKQAFEIFSHFKNQGEKSSIFHADARDPQQIKEIIDHFHKQWGRLDALIWAVGYTSNALTIRISQEQWDDQIQANLTGLFYCLRAVGPIFQEQGFGSVLVISSLASMTGGPGQTAYAATKAGSLGLIRSVAQEWGQANIRINAVFPGWHKSPLSGDAFPSPDDSQDHTLGRTPNLEETANLIYHLATARDISGQIFNLDNRLW